MKEVLPVIEDPRPGERDDPEIVPVRDPLEREPGPDGLPPPGHGEADPPMWAPGADGPPADTADISNPDSLVKG